MPVTRASNNKATIGSGSDQASLADIHETVENEGTGIEFVAEFGTATRDESTAGKKKRRALNWEKDNRTPRPANAFISFKSALKDGPYKHEYAARLATGENIGVIAQQMWKALREDERDNWYAAARKAKQEHSKKYPDYKYQPKKGKDKKKVSRRRVGQGDYPDEDDEEEADDGEEYNEEAGTCFAGVKEENATSAFTPSSDLNEDARGKVQGKSQTVEVYTGSSEDFDLLYQEGWKWALIRDNGPSIIDAPGELDIKNPIVHLPTTRVESSTNSMGVELVSMASVPNNPDASPETPESSMHLHTAGEAALFQHMFNPWGFPAPQPSAFPYDGQPQEASEGLMKLTST